MISNALSLMSWTRCCGTGFRLRIPLCRRPAPDGDFYEGWLGSSPGGDMPDHIRPGCLGGQIAQVALLRGSRSTLRRSRCSDSCSPASLPCLRLIVTWQRLHLADVTSPSTCCVTAGIWSSKKLSRWLPKSSNTPNPTFTKGKTHGHVKPRKSITHHADRRRIQRAAAAITARSRVSTSCRAKRPC